MSQDEHTLKPIRYDPAFEILEEDEAETAQGIVDQMRKILEITAKDYGHSVRSVHAKSHAILRGELEVYGNLPEAYAQGIFREGARYDAVLRFSTNPGDILDDSISVPRGLALKIIGVEGDRLEGSEGANTQDFVMINGPAPPTRRRCSRRSPPRRYAAPRRWWRRRGPQARRFCRSAAIRTPIRSATRSTPRCPSSTAPTWPSSRSPRSRPTSSTIPAKRS
jgi:hypothetical protein